MDLSAKNIGLVLSGGGSKAIAHAGVLHFLEQQRIYVHTVAGTSAGAIVAGLYAHGMKPMEILHFFKSIYFFHWRHFTISKPGFIDSDAFKPYLEKLFQQKKINDFSIRLCISATDLIQGKLITFSPDTLLVDAVLASSSFPGVFAPYEFNGTQYSDGGILNHFPIDLIQGTCDYYIGVYVSPIQNIHQGSLTTIKAVTSRAFDLLFDNSSQHKFALCNWLIKPETLAQYSTFETSKSKMDEIFWIGYHHAKNTFKTMPH